MSRKLFCRIWLLRGVFLLALCGFGVQFVAQLDSATAWQELSGSGEFTVLLSGTPATVHFGGRAKAHESRRCSCPSGTEYSCALLILRPDDPSVPVLDVWGPCDLDYLELWPWDFTRIWVEVTNSSESPRFKTYDINHGERWWEWKGQTFEAIRPN